MRNPLRRLLSWWRLRRDYYKCSRCGYSWPKRETKPSGWPDNSHPYGVHVHCPKCGAVVAQYIKKSSARGKMRQWLEEKEEHKKRSQKTR